MADVEEPQFTTLAQRIAALNAQKNFSSTDEKPQSQHKPRRPPPPPRPASKPRPPPLPTQTPSAPPTPASKPPPPPLPTQTPGAPPTPASKPPPPPLPSRTPSEPPPQNIRPQNGSAATRPPPNPPTRGPPQKPAPAPSPSLPPRRQTLHPTQPSTEPRRDSFSSDVSFVSSISNLSAGRKVSSSNASFASSDSLGSRKLPPAYDPAALPPLPPTKREREAQNRQQEAKEAPVNSQPRTSPRSTVGSRQIEPPPAPSLPPRLPSRPAKSPAIPGQQTISKPSTPRRLPPAPDNFVKPPPRPNPTVHVNGLNGHHQPSPPPIPTIPTIVKNTHDEPPPVPLSSRPSMSQIDAVATRSAASQVVSCLTCRDFSGPDAVAAQYPRANIPRDDPISFLARVLCDPFPSLTDKARAIFTWFHHNVDYDYENFCNGTVDRRAGPADVLLNGKAVCAGYANGYEAIATRAGMECVVVSGHGKGFGYKALKKGEAVPPKKASGHAWNAVRIDGGEWKLLDSCWGAGHIDSKAKAYTRKFTPVQFTATNEIFGRRHYPSDERYFFRKDGRVVPWEEYYRGDVPDGEPATKYGMLEEEGLAGASIAPAGLHIPVHSGDVVRFQMSRLCEHWTSERNGKGESYLFLLSIQGQDGKKTERVPLETDGFWFWLDVNARDLGAPGQSVQLVALTSFDGKDGRGLSKEDFLRQNGRVGMAWSGLAKWDLV